MTAADSAFEQLLAVAQEDARVVGLVLGGSRGKDASYVTGHSDYLIDKLDGEVGRMLAEKSRRDPAGAAGPLDGYINLYYRAAKNHRDGLRREAHLDAAESIPWFVDFLFTACGRVRPYNKWLPWELANHPLPDPWSARETERRLEAILATGDLGEQQTCPAT
jgi:hypothetical protein